MTTHRTETIMIFGFVLLGFVLRLGAVGYGLPQSFFGDELVHIAAAFSMIGEKAMRPNFSFYYLPPLFSYLLAPFFLASGALGIGSGFFSGTAAFREFVLLHREYFLMFSRVMSAVFGAATIWLLYQWGKKMFGRDAALLASAFLAFDLLHIHESQIGRLWAPTAFFFVWALYALWQWFESGKTKWMFSSVLAIGLGYGMGYIPILLLVLFFGVQIALRRRGKAMFDAYGIAAVGLLAAFILFFSFANQYGFWRQFGSVLATAGSGLHLRIAETPVGTTSENNFFANMASAFAAFWRDNPFLFLSGAAGLVFLFLRERFSAKFVFLVLFQIFYIAFVAGSASYFDGRYLLPVLPGLFLLGGFFLRELWNTETRFGLRRGIAFLFAGSALIFGAYGVLGYEALLQKPDTRLQAIRWMNEYIPEHSRVALNEHTMYVVPDSDGIALVERYHPERLDTRMRFLKTLDNARYPRPSYNVFDASRLGNDPAALMDFSPDYLIYSFWTEDEKQVKENEYGLRGTKRLVALFSPRRDGSAPEVDLLADPAAAYRMLPYLQSFGPTVAIYRIR